MANEDQVVDATIETVSAPQEPASPDAALQAQVDALMASFMDEVDGDAGDTNEPVVDEPVVDEPVVDEAVVAEPAKQQNTLTMTPEDLAAYYAKAVEHSKDMFEPKAVKAEEPAAEDPFGKTVEFTPEELKLLDENPILSKVIQDKLAAYHKSTNAAVLKEIEGIKQQLAVQEKQTASQTQEQTVSKVRAVIKDDFDTKTQHAKWPTFLEGQVPFQPKGVTYAAVLQHAASQNDVDRIVQVFNAFDVAPKPSVQAPAKPAKPAAVASPPLAASLMPNTDTGNTQDKASRIYEAAKQQHERAPSKATYVALQTAYDTLFGIM